jgi:hypothetical protein
MSTIPATAATATTPPPLEIERCKDHLGFGRSRSLIRAFLAVSRRISTLIWRRYWLALSLLRYGVKESGSMQFLGASSNMGPISAGEYPAKPQPTGVT